jgi:protein TonB
MSMAARAYQDHLLIFGAVVLINALIFILLPYVMLTQRASDVMPQVLDSFRPVHVFHFSEPTADPPPEKPENPVPVPEKQPCNVPDRLDTTFQEIRPAPSQVAFEAPCFEISPRFATGAPVALPPRQVQAAPVTPPVSKVQATPVRFKPAYDQAEVDQVPMAVIKTPPVYPYRARRLNLSGEVRVKFMVDIDGRVRQIKIIGAEPPEVFNGSVINALSAWRFTPGHLKGMPVATWVTTTIVFQMEDAG